MTDKQKQLFDTAIKIMPGLLASGHYTGMDPDTDAPYVFTPEDDSPEYERYADAVSDAVMLSKELIDYCETE